MMLPHEYVDCHCPILYSHCAICGRTEECCRRALALLLSEIMSAPWKFVPENWIEPANWRTGGRHE